MGSAGLAQQDRVQGGLHLLERLELVQAERVVALVQPFQGDQLALLVDGGARFVIADLSDAKSVLPELELIAAGNAMLPVQPLITAAQEEPGMFDVIERFPSVLRTYRYGDPAKLTAEFDTLVQACRLKSWNLQRHSHEALWPDVGRPAGALAGISPKK